MRFSQVSNLDRWLRQDDGDVEVNPSVAIAPFHLALDMLRAKQSEIDRFAKRSLRKPLWLGG